MLSTCKLKVATRTRYCSECRDGERLEPATTIVSYTKHTNVRTVRVSNKYVCSDHSILIFQDYEDCKARPLLPSSLEEAEAWRYKLPPNLREIAEGNRIGIPTLDRNDPLQRAAGILSQKEVSWLR